MSPQSREPAVPSRRLGTRRSARHNRRDLRERERVTRLLVATAVPCTEAASGEALPLGGEPGLVPIDPRGNEMCKHVYTWSGPSQTMTNTLPHRISDGDATKGSDQGHHKEGA